MQRGHGRLHRDPLGGRVREDRRAEHDLAARKPVVPSAGRDRRQDDRLVAGEVTEPHALLHQQGDDLGERLVAGKPDEVRARADGPDPPDPVVVEDPIGRVLDPGVDHELFGGVHRAGGAGDHPAVHRLDPVLGGEGEPPLPFADQTLAQERRLTPERPQRARERKLVPRHRVHERAVLTGGPPRERVFLGVIAGDQLRESADRALVRAADRVLGREAGADDAEHEVDTRVVAVDALGGPAHVRVVAPVLADRVEVGKLARRPRLEEPRVLLGAVDDVPLR